MLFMSSFVSYNPNKYCKSYKLFVHATHTCILGILPNFLLLYIKIRLAILKLYVYKKLKIILFQLNFWDSHFSNLYLSY